MNQSEKLDKILEGLTFTKMKRDYNEENNTGDTIIDICNVLKISLFEGEEKILEAKLLDDGYIEYINNRLKYLLRISNKGVNFIYKGGYQQLDNEQLIKLKEEKLNLQLIESNITTNNWTKVGILLSILISVIALLISIVSILKK